MADHGVPWPFAWVFHPKNEFPVLVRVPVFPAMATGVSETIKVGRGTDPLVAVFDS